MLLASEFRGRSLTESQLLWNDLAMTVLGKTKIESDDDQDLHITLGPVVVINAH
jgi:ATP-dependent RNA helicase DHX29